MEQTARRAMLAVPLSALATGSLIALLAACSPKAADEVVVYTSVDQVFSEPILKAYEQKTGVKVKAVYDVEAAKTTGLVTRLEAEKAAPQADVFWNNEFAQTLGLAAKGVLQAYPSKSADDLPAEFKDAQGLWAGMGGRARVFIVNTGKLEPKDYPSRLDDLLDARWPAEQVGIANPLFGTTATQAAALYAARGPEGGKAFYTALKARGVRVVDGNSVVRDLVANGQLAWGLTDTDDAAEAMAAGKPVKALAPDQGDGQPGTLVIPGTVALVAGAPHAEQGRKLVDHLLSAATEAALIQAGGAQTSLRGRREPPAPASAASAASAVAGMAAIRPMAVSLQQVQAQLPRALAELREVFVK